MSNIEGGEALSFLAPTSVPQPPCSTAGITNPAPQPCESQHQNSPKNHICFLGEEILLQYSIDFFFLA